MNDSDASKTALVRALVYASLVFMLGGGALTLLTLQFPPHSMARWLSLVGSAWLVMMLEHFWVRRIYPFQSLRYAFMYTVIALSASLLSRNISLSSNMLLIVLAWAAVGGIVGLVRYFQERRRFGSV